jgi:1-acyl-sn-glycerol-3-phosphate acyltransferase
MESILPSVTPPPKKLAEDLLRLFDLYFSPRIFGMENAKPEKPALYVCNHTIYGLTDGFYVGAYLYREKNIWLRSLGDNMHQEVPVWRKIAQDMGMVRASREVCAELMRQKQHIMVFPGGTREVCKNKGEAYHLIWKQRVGFAHMAIEFGYDIVPVASVGGEELFRILLDANEIMGSPLGILLKATGFADKYLKGGENIPPLSRGIGFTGIPRPERLYIKLGEHITTGEYRGKEDDHEALFELRNKVETAIMDMIDELKSFRRNDTDEEWWRKLLKRL